MKKKIFVATALALFMVGSGWNQTAKVYSGGWHNYATDSKNVRGLICLPSDNLLHKISLAKKGNQFILEKDPLAGKVSWSVRLYSK